MNRSLLLLVLSLSPLLADAATEWKPWWGAYVRLENDGNIACATDTDPKRCNWASKTVPSANAPSLACGSQHLKLYGISGYDSVDHWCNKAYADVYANWTLGNFSGFDVYLAANPAGELMCDSSNGLNCYWYQDANATGPVKPINPLVCGVVHKSIHGQDDNNPDHWCNQARIQVDYRDYSDSSWANATFDYDRGWAGMGFGLTGSQRGAPEAMRITSKDGHRGLGIKSLVRDAAWFKQHPTGPYSKADREAQDDLFMYGKKVWHAEDEPVLVMHIYRPKGTTVSLRMPSIYNNRGAEDKRWPGVWLKPQGIRLRTVKGDFYVADAALENTEGRWWTLGMKITKQGDIEYYAAANWVDSPFDDSFLRGKQSTLLGSSAFNVIRQADAVVMISNVLPNNAEAIIGDIRYGMKTPGQKTSAN